MKRLWLLLLLGACDTAGPDLSLLMFACETPACVGADAGALHADGGEVDAGDSAGGRVDGGHVDGGNLDPGNSDGGNPDSGSVDAGPVDAGSIDAGPVDAGPVDAGCASGSWCWSGLPQHALRGIAANQPDDFWAVGDFGTILRYDVQGVRQVDSGTTRDLFGVWGQGPSLAWAVGHAGTALRYNGTRWSAASTTTTSTLRSVSGLHGADVWAVGEQGVIQHFTGTVWSSVPSGTTNALLCVKAVATDDVWAGGFGGTLLHWDGVQWSPVAVPTTDTLVAVVALLSGERFVATAAGLVLQQTGTGWVTHSQAVLNLRAFHGVSPNDLWAFGMFDEVHHWDGTDWSPVQTPVGANWMGAAGYTSFNLVGEGGAFLRWDNLNGAFFSLRDVEPSDVNELLGFADDDLWAVGNSGLVRHWDGAAWATSHLAPRPALRAITGATATDLWASGDGRLYRWMGVGWQEYPTVPCSVFSMHALAADDVWAVGALGCALHWDGAGWTSRSTGLPMVTLRSVRARASNEVWAVGDSGAAFRFDGTSWSPMNTPTSQALYKVMVVNGDLVAVGGAVATTLRYRQGVWSALTTPLQGGFRGGVPDGAGGFFSVGTPLDTSSAAPVLRHDGVAYSTNVSPPVREALQAAWLSPSGALWVGGTGGVLLYRPRWESLVVRASGRSTRSSGTRHRVRGMCQMFHRRRHTRGQVGRPRTHCRPGRRSPAPDRFRETRDRRSPARSRASKDRHHHRGPWWHRLQRSRMEAGRNSEGLVCRRNRAHRRLSGQHRAVHPRRRAGMTGGTRRGRCMQEAFQRPRRAGHRANPPAFA